MIILIEVELLDHLLPKNFQSFQYFQKTGIIIPYRFNFVKRTIKKYIEDYDENLLFRGSSVNLISCELKNQIKSSLCSTYYAEACNELRGPSPRLST